jgi:hypothetical protein
MSGAEHPSSLIRLGADGRRRQRKSIGIRVPRQALLRQQTQWLGDRPPTPARNPQVLRQLGYSDDDRALLRSERGV